jgi:hypothetical protein
MRHYMIIFRLHFNACCLPDRRNEATPKGKRGENDKIESADIMMLIPYEKVSDH